MGWKSYDYIQHLQNTCVRAAGQKMFQYGTVRALCNLSEKAGVWLQPVGVVVCSHFFSKDRGYYYGTSILLVHTNIFGSKASSCRVVARACARVASGRGC